MAAMRQIGQGYYHRVYDLENGRVLKKQTGHLFRLKKLMEWYGKTPQGKIRVLLMYPKYIRDIRQTLSDSIRVAALDSELFGNPTFREEFEYEQDKAITLDEYFKTHTLEENKQVFEAYPKSLQLLWMYGVSDTVFNFTINNGLSLRSNALIYVDFNEFTRSKDKIMDCIRKEKWRTQASLRDMPESELKDYILSKMKEEITLEKLDALWGMKVNET